MKADLKHTHEKLNLGKIVSVRGSVIDAFFEESLPPVYTLLHAGEKKEIAIEVLSQLDDHTVRGIALTPTQGLARGMQIETDGNELMVPVGKRTLGRMFDVLAIP